ncbi:MAG: polyprenyl synthetase family protein, partial [Chloroflexota bacterium]
RGKPTLNSVLSSNAVILLGDYLFAQSAILAAATGDPRVVGIFASSLADICDGQLHEMFHSHRLDQSRQDYERRIYGKTAALFAGAAEMGAIIGRAPESHVASLRKYGTDLGMAFQIVDDVLDLREGTQKLGKPAGNDLRQGTVTLPTMLYAAKLEPGSPELVALEQVVSGDELDDDRLADVVAAIRRSSAIDDAMAVAAEYTNAAKAAAAVVPDAETRLMLFEVADLALGRDS